MDQPRVLAADYLLAGPGRDPLRDVAVRLEAGRIVAVLEGEAAAQARAEAGCLDLGPAVLMPGLVLAHTHVDYGAFAGHGDGLDFLPWIRSLQARKTQAEAPPDFLAGARLSCLQLVASGVTGVAEATDPGTTAAQALVESGLRAICFQEEFAPDPADAARTLDRLRGKLDRLEEISAGTRVQVGVSPHAPYTLSRQLFAGMVEEARARGMGLSIHLAETPDEVELVRHGAGPLAEGLRARGIPVEARGVSPYGYLRDQGWLEAPGPVLLVHGVQLEPADLEDLGERPGTWLVHCPRSNARLGEGIAPVPAARRAGVRWVLGSDGACSADRLDPFEEVRAAVWLARAASRDAGALGHAEALAALWRGHAALGFGTGEVAAGEPADLCAVDLTGPYLAAACPDAGAVAALASASDVCLTMVAGEILYSRRGFHRVDAGAVLAAVRV